MVYQTTTQNTSLAVPAPYSRLESAFRLSAEAEGKSSRTIDTYSEALRGLGVFMVANNLPTDPKRLKREHIEGFLAGMRKAVSAKTGRPYTAGTLNNRFRGLQGIFRWACDAGYMVKSPLTGMRPPRLNDVPIPIISDQHFAAMLRTCGRRGFLGTRDRALLLLLYDSGMRLAEATDIKLSDIDWQERVLTVLGKGGKKRNIPLGRRVTTALRTYVDTVREKHPLNYRAELWLGREKVMTANGIYQMVRERATAIGLSKMHPHIFRHTFIHNCLAKGMAEGHVMELTGISSREMMDRYARSTRSQRAIADHRRLSPADNLSE